MKLNPTNVLYAISAFTAVAGALPTTINLSNSSTISPELFESLEELSRIVDITYCVGSTGIQKPFTCASRCNEFEGFELVEQWNTGILMSDSCGYVALSHPPFEKRIIVAFRGTYSIANTVVDLSTVPAEYLPYPSEDDESSCVSTGSVNNAQHPLNSPSELNSAKSTSQEPDEPCANCTAHAGFLTAWKNTRCTIMPLIESAKRQYPDYQLTLVGHSLGGAVAALASLEFLGRGWEPQVTTFGEPRVGNQALVDYIDRRFKMHDQESKERTYRRVTHVDDPVPLLPLDEWGYKMHAGEIFISKKDLSPARSDIHHCSGDEDGSCITGTQPAAQAAIEQTHQRTVDGEDNLGIWTRQERLSSLDLSENADMAEAMEKLRAAALDWRIPNRYRLWELFFAHRDYFWRLGLCVPHDWWKSPFQGHDGDGMLLDGEMPNEAGKAINDEDKDKAEL